MQHPAGMLSWYDNCPLKVTILISHRCDRTSWLFKNAVKSKRCLGTWKIVSIVIVCLHCARTDLFQIILHHFHSSDFGWLLYERRWGRVVGTVCLVPLSTSITSGVRSRPQHLGRMISLIDRWAPPVAHCNDLSPSKLWPLVACVHERIGKWTNVMSLKVFDLFKNNLNIGTIMLIIRELFPNIIWKVQYVKYEWIHQSSTALSLRGISWSPSQLHSDWGGLRTGQVISSSVMIHSNKWIIYELSRLAKAKHHTTFGRFLYFIQYLWLASWLCGPSFSTLLPPPGWRLLPDGPTTVQLNIQKCLYWLSTVSKYVSVMHALVFRKGVLLFGS